MKLKAKIHPAQNQIRIMKTMSSGQFRMSLVDAKHAYNSGKVTDSNRAFKLLVANDFDVPKTIAMYK